MDESNAVEHNLNITAQEGSPKPRKLKVKWTLEAAQELRNLWGTDVVADLAEQMQKEIDARILHDLTRTDRLVQGWLFA